MLKETEQIIHYSFHIILSLGQLNIQQLSLYLTKTENILNFMIPKSRFKNKEIKDVNNSIIFKKSPQIYLYIQEMFLHDYKYKKRQRSQSKVYNT